jgi:tRNA U34 2-thiouridine synthase MnmA/TrmU
MSPNGKRVNANCSRAVPGGRALMRPADEDRDQSYFLFGTTREAT